LPQDQAFHRYAYEGEEETVHFGGIPTYSLA
jgi:hypothetical protein